MALGLVLGVGATTSHGDVALGSSGGGGDIALGVSGRGDGVFWPSRYSAGLMAMAMTLPFFFLGLFSLLQFFN